MWIPKSISGNTTQRTAERGSVVYSEGGKMSVAGSIGCENVKKAVPYGIAYSAPLGEKTVTIPVGNADVCVGVVENNNNNLEQGEIMLFSSGGAKIILKNDGTVIINGQVFEKEAE